ncbi:MAG: hypothetical protein AB8G17_02635 [Gammaproteobacteria bacterium]
MRHRNYTLCVRVAWAVAVVGIGASAIAQSLLPSDDGWYAWPIDAVEGAEFRCCFHWDDNQPKTKACKLDSIRTSYGNSDLAPPSHGSAIVYAQKRDGAVVRVHTFSSSCEVTTREGIAGLGNVTPRQSLSLLEGALRDGVAQTHEAIGAIAMHTGDEAARMLVRLADEREEKEVRKSAVFFMGQLRGAETENELTNIMFTDPSDSMREHAAFSISESSLPNREDLLVRLGNEDPEPGVRGKAWFWLAQTESPQVEGAIFACLEAEASVKARHEAIFALAQLPEERAARALIRVIESRDNSAADRKQALFWLAQGESDAGLDYLSRVLSTAGE